jgi:hypothetical protein
MELTIDYSPFEGYAQAVLTRHSAQVRVTEQADGLFLKIALKRRV